MLLQSKRLWPYKNHSITAKRVLNKIKFYTKRPWYRGMELPKGHTSLVTRLRINHICTYEHYRRMRWNILSDCLCGQGEISLVHLLNDCPSLSPGRPGFFGYLNAIDGNFSTPLLDLDKYIFTPNK